VEHDTQLGLAILIAESNQGYEPVAVVVSVDEAREVAKSNAVRRNSRTLPCDEDVFLPVRYSIWAPGLNGRYRLLRDHILKTADLLTG